MTKLATRFGHNSTSIRRDRPLTETEMREVAPSIFAEGAHESRSDKYTYLPTIQIVQAMQGEGFEPFMVAQGRTLVPGKGAFTKHLVRYRQPGVPTSGRDGAFEVIQINSHDGSSAHQLIAGYIRFMCLNSMVCGDILADVKIQHRGDVVGQVIEGSYEVVKDTALITDRRDAMMAMDLTRMDQLDFADAALTLAYAERRPLQPDQVLSRRRPEDERPSIWHVLNTVQENLIKGGLPGRTSNNRAFTTSPVAALDRDTELNRGLWTLANRALEYKSTH